MAVSEEIQKQVLAEATSATPSFETDYSDERFDKVNQEYNADLSDLENTYGGMIGDTDGFYENLSNAMQEQADKQAQIQQENTDFAIEKIEQQKDQANKDYIKEQSGAYVDWQKQSNQYGVEAEKMAAAGLTNTGFSESSQVGVYNTYQNRVATAKETLSRITLEYNNNIKEAQLQNNATLAQIYSDLYIKQMELTLEGFQYKNQLVLELANKKQELKDNKWQKELAIIQQQNVENELAWDAWKYSDTQKWQTEQAELDRKFQAEQAEITRKFEEAQAELDRKHDFALLEAKTAAEKKAADEQHKRDLEKLQKQQEYELAQLDKQLASEKELLKYQQSLSSSNNSAKVGGSSGDSVGSTSNSYYKKITQDEQKISGNKSYAVNTAYYQGNLNSDVRKYGTFSNGYQPKGISDHGEVKKSNATYTFKTKTLSGQRQTVTQNVWMTSDGKYWYWEGRENRYIELTYSAKTKKFSPK